MSLHPFSLGNIPLRNRWKSSPILYKYALSQFTDRPASVSEEYKLRRVYLPQSRQHTLLQCSDRSQYGEHSRGSPARDLSQQMPVGGFDIRYYFLDDRHIGTGSRRTDQGSDQCIFEFGRLPADSWLQCHVAALARFHDMNKNDMGDMQSLEELLVVHVGGNYQMNAQAVGELLLNVMHLQWQCEDNNGSSSDDGDDGADAQAVKEGDGSGISLQICVVPDGDCGSGCGADVGDSDSSSGGNDGEDEAQGAEAGPDSDVPAQSQCQPEGAPAVALTGIVAIPTPARKALAPAGTVPVSLLPPPQINGYMPASGKAMINSISVLHS